MRTSAVLLIAAFAVTSFSAMGDDCPPEGGE